MTTPSKLQNKIEFQSASNDNPLWNYLLSQRLGSTVASDGTWIANNGVSIHCVAHVMLESGRVNLFCRDPSNETAVQASIQIIHYVAERLLERNTGDDHEYIGLRFSALDRRLLPTFRSFLEEHYEIKSSYEAPCGMWLFNSSANNNNPSLEDSTLPPNAKLRPLTPNDAQLIDSRWEYRSDTSISMVQEMIAAGGSCCQGLQVDGTLVAWVLQYLDGTLGMLWTEPDHRGKGHGALVVHAATRKEERAWIAFNVDTNTASRGVFTKLNWKRVHDADWVGFTLQRKGEGGGRPVFS